MAESRPGLACRCHVETSPKEVFRSANTLMTANAAKRSVTLTFIRLIPAFFTSSVEPPQPEIDSSPYVQRQQQVEGGRSYDVHLEPHREAPLDEFVRFDSVLKIGD